MPYLHFGNPVESGLQAFGQVMNIANTIDEMRTRREERPMRRQLQSLQLQRESLATEKTQMEMENLKRVQTHQKNVGVLAGIYARFTDPQTGQVNDQSLKDYIQSGKMTDDEKAAMGYGYGKGSLGGDDINDLDKNIESASKVRELFQNINPEALKKGGSINLDAMPETKKAINQLYEDVFNKGDSRLGKVGTNGVRKEVKGLVIDKDQTVTPILKISAPVQEGNVFPHQGDGKPHYMAPSDPSPTGLVEPGNIDLNNQPVVGHANGSISTVKSMSFDEDGKEVVVPMVSPEGKMLSDKEAFDLYRKTGKHLGKFDSAANATQYANKLHSDPMWNADLKMFSAPSDQKEISYEAPATHGNSVNPKSVVQKIPIQILGGNLTAHEQLWRMMQVARANMDPSEYMATLGKQREASIMAEAAKEPTTGAAMNKYLSLGGTDVKTFNETLKDRAAEEKLESQERREEKKAEVADKRQERREDATDRRQAEREKAADRRQQEREDRADKRRTETEDRADKRRTETEKKEKKIKTYLSEFDKSRKEYMKRIDLDLSDNKALEKVDDAFDEMKGRIENGEMTDVEAMKEVKEVAKKEKQKKKDEEAAAEKEKEGPVKRFLKGVFDSGSKTQTSSRNNSKTPSVGTVIKGYRFKGGDPSKQENWEKV